VRRGGLDCVGRFFLRELARGMDRRSAAPVAGAAVGCIELPIFLADVKDGSCRLVRSEERSAPALSYQRGGAAAKPQEDRTIKKPALHHCWMKRCRLPFCCDNGLATIR